jgi:hypothetical protein
MSDSIEYENGFFGLKAIIKAPWTDIFLDELLNRNIVELELNDGKGWKGENLDFLENLKHIKALTVIDLRLKFIKGVNNLRELVKLDLVTYSSEKVDFNSFESLIDCTFEWIKGCDSLFESTSLKYLFINNYKGKNSNVFSNLINLEKLSIMNSSMENIDGLSDLNMLKALRLANLKNITSLKGIEKLTKLQELEIQRCKGISKIDDIFHLVDLKRLLLLDIGVINSLKGIGKLINLEEFLFYESTNIADGDISPLLTLRRLKNISFQNRKHYTHKREEIQKILGF